MTEQEREELIEKMAIAICEDFRGGTTYKSAARAALAVAEPVIRERCAEDAAAIAKEHLTDAVAGIVAAAIREGGRE